MNDSTYIPDINDSTFIPTKDDALKAVLLFYTVGEWSWEKRQEWYHLTRRSEATTKVLCDTVRLALSHL